MTKAEEHELRKQRRKRAYGIMYSAYKFKVCEQCFSISDKRRGICEVCGAYSWDESEERVYEVAKIMSNQLYPVTIGYPQRQES